jgi:hypothetical protein
MTEHPGEQFPPDVDPDVEPGFDPYESEETPGHPDYDTEPGAQDTAETQHAAHETGHDAVHEAGQEAGHVAGQEAVHEAGPEVGQAAEHVDPAAVEFGPEFARAPGEEHEHPFEAASAEDVVESEGGHPLVEETMGRLDELRDRPVSEHGEVYADLHERLQSALVEADAEQSDRG